MVGDNTKRNIGFVAFTVLNTNYGRNVLHNILNCVNKEQIVNPLHYTGKSFKSHTCVDIWVVKWGVVALSVTVELGENKVPNLHKPVAVTAYCTALFATAVFFSTVVVDFGARATGTATVFPEVILLAKANHMALFNTYLLSPDVVGLIIIFVN